MLWPANEQGTSLQYFSEAAVGRAWLFDLFSLSLVSKTITRSITQVLWDSNKPVAELQWASHGWSPVQAPWLRAGTGPPPADRQTAFGSSVLMAFLFLPGRGSFFFFFLVLFKPLSDKTVYFPAVRGGCLRSGAEVCVAAAVDICLCKVSRKTARNQAASWRWWLSRGLNLS